MCIQSSYTCVYNHTLDTMLAPTEKYLNDFLRKREKYFFLSDAGVFHHLLKTTVNLGVFTSNEIEKLFNYS